MQSEKKNKKKTTKQSNIVKAKTEICKLFLFMLFLCFPVDCH